jgi:uncharacterized membrane protein YeaQ/YmgE (transglycosylase-associated protein family)
MGSFLSNEKEIGSGRQAMQVATINFIIQLVTGILGSHAAALVAKEHGFGFIGHTLIGAVCGALSGYFLQAFAINIVDSTGASRPPGGVDNAIMQALCGLAVGAIGTLVVGMLRHFIAQHKAGS